MGCSFHLMVALLAANQFDDPPFNRFYATVALDVTSVGNGEGYPGMDLTAVLRIDGAQHADCACGASIDSGPMDAPTLANGGRTSFRFCLNHPGVYNDVRLMVRDTFLECRCRRVGRHALLAPPMRG